MSKKQGTLFDIESEVITVDTSFFERIDYDVIFGAFEEVLGKK